jgi:hypothetical protein
MNDLELISGLTPDAPLPRPDELAPARDRLTAAIQADIPIERTSRMSALSRGAGQPGRALPGRRAALTAATAAATIAVIATAVAIMPGHRRPSPIRPAAAPPSTQPASSQPGSTQTPPVIDVAAVRFLEQAAVAVEHQSAQVPGPGQFVYTESEGRGKAYTYQTWLSAYGNRDGLVRNSGQPAFILPPCTPAQAAKTGGRCSEEAGYIADMPTNPRRLLAYLYQIGIAQPADRLGTSWATNDFGKAVDYLLSTTFLTPAQHAALFELMARFPGFTIVASAPDAIGRVGVAIRWTYGGSPAEIILNPVTYAYLGDRTWPEPGFKGPGAGGYNGAALVKMAFVNRAGQLP